MKAPDKIFIHKKDLSYSEVKESDSDIIFIRKDALLEWAKEKQEQMKTEAGGCSNMLAVGKYLAYGEIIDKIESL